MPPEQRPAWLRPYVLVEGVISSAPLDLPRRFEQVIARLQALGWRVSVKSIGTDFGFIPLPKDQPLALYLLRPDRPFTAREAHVALASVLQALNMNYSPVREWAAEVVREVVRPSLRTGTDLGKVAVVGALVIGALLLTLRDRQ